MKTNNHSADAMAYALRGSYYSGTRSSFETFLREYAKRALVFEYGGIGFIEIRVPF